MVCLVVARLGLLRIFFLTLYLTLRRTVAWYLSILLVEVLPELLLHCFPVSTFLTNIFQVQLLKALTYFFLILTRITSSLGVLTIPIVFLTGLTGLFVSSY
ncbi:hypothetical protein [Cherry robigovirus 5]|nr:hypothetical protein [Cherry robigovirus 5]